MSLTQNGDSFLSSQSQDFESTEEMEDEGVDDEDEEVEDDNEEVDEEDRGIYVLYPPSSSSKNLRLRLNKPIEEGFASLPEDGISISIVKPSDDSVDYNEFKTDASSSHRLSLPRQPSFTMSFLNNQQNLNFHLPTTLAIVQPYFLSETTKSASWHDFPEFNGQTSSNCLLSRDTGISSLAPPHRSSSVSLATSPVSTASINVTGTPVPTHIPRYRRHSAFSFQPSTRSSTSHTRRFPSPGRTLSELQGWKSSLSLHIHESLLSIASSYGKSRKQSDQMVSVSFKSLESFVTEDNLLGLQAFLASRAVVIDDRDENGASVLILCATKGKEDFCKALLDHGADVNAEDNDNWTALTAAAKEGHASVVQTLLDHDASVDHRDLGGWTSLLWACYKGHLQTVKTLLAHRADPNVQGQHHMSPLVWAAGRGHTEVVKELLAKGAKVSLGDKFGTTPLIWACRKGFIEISEDLLRHGSNVDAAGMYSWTPLLVATRGNYVDLVNLLLEYKPNVNALDKDGGTALTIACKEGYSEISSALLRAGAYVNIQDRNGDSNLIFACRGGHKRVVESLLKKHADIDCVGKDRKTAIYWAVEKNHIMVVKLLLSVNADLEHATKDGDTVLLRAVRAKNADIVQMLVDKKIRVSVADKKGDTALHIAMRGRSKRIVEILLRNPKNSQILYRPNKSGETPYNIDLSHQKTILGQIFGARRLNTNEENENMLGYDLYSSSLADILSEPSLSMPISVGLYARWGSGKSFLIRKLREEMNNFARQWVEPLFQFSALVFTVVVFISFMLGFITHLSTKLWYVGLATGGGVFLLIILILVAIWYGSRSKYDWHLWYRWSVGLACHTADFKLVSQVIFCSPPGDQWKEWKDGVQAKPLKFIFAEGSKPSSTGAGGSSVIQILGSLFTSIEDQYGIFSTRFFRAFRPKPHGESSPWKFRRLCGIPYIVIFFTTFACSITLTYLAVTYGFHSQTVIPVQKTLEVSKDQKSLQKREVIEPKFEIELPKFIVKRNVFRPPEDDEDDDDDENEEEDESERKRKGEKESDGGQALHGQLINPLLFILSGLVALVVVANIHTLVRMVKALIFSHRRHLVSAISKFDTMSAEGYIPTLKSEVDLMVDMVKCLDAFTFQQTRLVVILDGLDSCEQDKVLSVLDAVHSLFTDSNGPFIILLAIDPHIISRAIEMNANKVFREATISGHDYLRNIIHLPFYLQNAGLRKVKLAEQASELLKSRTQNLWNEQETEFVSLATTSVMGGLHHMPVTRHMSSASELGYNIGNRRMSGESGAISLARRNTTKNSRRLKPSDSIGSSIGSNLNRVSAASDLNKVLLTDDYFNDINPRSMRRLMNVVYITGRLLKAFHIEFNWYHLALWVNITEQWPYRASWLIHYYERREDSCDDKTNLKDLYERVKSQMPSSKEVEPLLEMDRDERKFETFLSMHENILHIFNMVIFLPFTINLDPYIKKKIKEDELQMDEAYPRISPPNSMQWHLAQPPPIDTQSRSSTLSWPGKQVPNNKQFGGTLPPTLNPLMWGYGGPFANNTLPLTQGHYNPLPLQAPINMNSITLPAEAENKKLSTLSVDEIFELLGKVDGVSTSLMPTYQEKLKENNINGKVLLHCNLDDLKQILKMTFGDWELFRMLIVGLREQEFNSEDDLLNKNIKYFSANTFADNHRPLNNLESLSSEQSDSSIIMDGIKKGTHRGSFSSREREDSISLSRRNIKHNIHAKQVSMEEQMIFGALQTLNEEAFEDVIEEQARNEALMAKVLYGESDVIEEECSDDQSGRRSRRSSGTLSINRPEEIDVMYLQSSPLLPRTIVSCISDCESTSQSLASSFSPYKCPTSLSRASSVRGGGGSTSASPKHSVTEKPIIGIKGEKTLNDIKVYSSPQHKVSPNIENNSPSKRERPQSLIINQEKQQDDRDDENFTIAINNVDDLNCLTSLPDLFNGQHITRHLSISEQISASSSSSIEKLRKLTKKLHRALSGPEDSQVCDNIDDPEASPLVLSTPSTGNSGNFSPSNCINGELESKSNSKVFVKAYSASSSPTKSGNLSVIITNHKYDCESHV